MNGTKTMGLRLPVQAAVDRTATGATLGESNGISASQSQLPQNLLQQLLNQPTGLNGVFRPLLF